MYLVVHLVYISILNHRIYINHCFHSIVYHFTIAIKEHSIFPWSEDVLQPSPETTPAPETAETDTLVDSNVRKLDAEEERAVGEGKKREGEEKDGKEDMERIARVPGDGTDTSGELIRGQEIIRENPMNSSFTSVSTDDDSSSQNTSDQGQPDIVRQTVRGITSGVMVHTVVISRYVVVLLMVES